MLVLVITGAQGREIVLKCLCIAMRDVAQESHTCRDAGILQRHCGRICTGLSVGMLTCVCHQSS